MTTSLLTYIIQQLKTWFRGSLPSALFSTPSLSFIHEITTFDQVKSLGRLFVLLSIIYGSGCTSTSSDMKSFDMSIVSQDLALSSLPSSSPHPFNSQDALHLVVGQNWTPVAPSQDPFAPLIEDRIVCDWTSFGVEYGGIEVNTGRCGYITLTQPTLSAIDVTSSLKISAWHTPLLKGDLQGDAFFSLMVGNQLIWEKKLRIPSEAVSWEEIIQSPLYAPEGTPLFLNVRNHGANSWVFHQFQSWTPTP